ncbi:hypothetical protein N6H18_13275 [Reichenbachiella agarivorans]|uniref:Lipoprotein n=1 Tax=Reichenbachiella agarivorans TaxID=2979464 RepID=A0ABY6CSS0_9BACT|nr:hypothetical protein [Reichenbachiella agarivorans]UXP31320.1 hypothetical protein N6H18_13275 [Reichenbachiella agarivorans]
MKKLIAILFIPLVMFSACTEDDSTNNGENTEPTVPPSSTMAPDLSSFNDDSAAGERTALIGNWGYAALNVGIYTGILYKHLVVPVTAYQVTVGTKGYYNEETDLWIWEKNFDIPTKGSYSVKLTASVEGDDVDWKGYISQSGEIDGFVWFTGESKVGGESGSWSLYESPEEPTVWLTSEWTAEDDSDMATATFTVEKEGDNMGSSIKYESDESAELDRIVTIYDASLDNEVVVMWNQTQAYGRVMSEAHFEDTEYHCWNTDLIDTDCE